MILLFWNWVSNPSVLILVCCRSLQVDGLGLPPSGCAADYVVGGWMSAAVVVVVIVAMG